MSLFRNTICALSFVALFAGCSCANEHFSSDKVITDDRVVMKDDSSFAVRNLKTVTRIDDDGLLTVDVTAELSHTSFWYWLFHGDPLQSLVYRFDWIDSQGKTDAFSEQSLSVFPGSILCLHGVAPAEKYTSFKLLIELGRASSVQEKAPAAKNEPSAANVQKAEVKPAADANVQKAEVKPAADANVQKAEVKPAAETRKSTKLTEPLY